MTLAPDHPVARYASTRSQTQVAEQLSVTPRQVRRWLSGESPVPDHTAKLINALDAPVDPTVSKFTFTDLFAGIGGTRLGFETAGGSCVFTSEWNKYAQQTYATNFSNRADHSFAGDITRINATDIPDHDVLVGGFPCQPFSIAGVSKKNALGRAHGFEDATQGTLFFDLARIIDEKRPKAFLLENVKNLASHDGGKTFKVIMGTLEEELGYRVHPRIVDASPWVPQGRRRILLVGFKEDNDFDFDDLRPPREAPTMADILHPEDGSEAPEAPYTDAAGRVSQKYILTQHLWDYLQAYKIKHSNAGNGFGFGLVTPRDVARTLSARYYKDGSEILVSRGEGQRPRRLTPRECARLMGFDDRFSIPVSDTQAYKQFGNSVVVPVIAAVAQLMADHL